MGLNWHKGLEGASKGMQTIIGVKEKEIDMLYDEIVRENRQRFQTSEREAAQEFRSTEAETERDWRSTEGSEERDWKGAENEADRAVRREGFDVQMERIEEDRQYRRSMMEDRRRNTDIRESESGEGADNDKVTQETLQKLRDKRDELTGKLVPGEGDKESIAQIDEHIKMVEKYGAYGAVAYSKVATNLQGHPDTERYAGLYASLNSKTRKEIDQAAGQYVGKGDTQGAAFMKAIDEYMTKQSGATGGGSDTTLDNAASDVDLEGSVGNTPVPETEITDEASVPASKTSPKEEPTEVEQLANRLAEKFEDKGVKFLGGDTRDKDIVLNKIKTAQRDMYLSWAARILSGDAEMPAEMGIEQSKFVGSGSGLPRGGLASP